MAVAYRTNDLLRDKLHLHLGQVVELTDRVKELESEKRELLSQIVIRREEQASNEELGNYITFGGMTMSPFYVSRCEDGRPDGRPCTSAGQARRRICDCDCRCGHAEGQSTYCRIEVFSPDVLDAKHVDFIRIVDLERNIANDDAKLQLLAAAQDECKKAAAECVPQNKVYCILSQCVKFTGMKC